MADFKGKQTVSQNGRTKEQYHENLKRFMQVEREFFNSFNATSTLQLIKTGCDSGFEILENVDSVTAEHDFEIHLSTMKLCIAFISYKSNRPANEFACKASSIKAVVEHCKSQTESTNLLHIPLLITQLPNHNNSYALTILTADWVSEFTNTFTAFNRLQHSFNSYPYTSHYTSVADLACSLKNIFTPQGALSLENYEVEVPEISS